jgi:nitrogen fixation protein FixH
MTVATVKQLNGRHVLYMLAGFFGTMLAVNAIFVYCALSSFSGIESDAYQTGLHYNQRIDAGARQAALGWSHTLTFAPDEGVSLTVTDRQGARVSGLVVSGDLGRPVAERFTRTLAFRETGPGLYLAPAGTLEAGSWIVSAQARRAAADSSEPAYQIKERLWLKPRP